MSAEAEVLFEAATPLGFTACVTPARWEIITTHKHPVMVGCEAEVKATLESPDEIRRSRSDADVRTEHTREETGDEIVLMKDRAGHVIGFEKLNYPGTKREPVKISYEQRAQA